MIFSSHDSVSFPCCESALTVKHTTPFLFAGILKGLNYGSCLINPPNHVAVGVLGSEELQGVYYELDGKRYYYCETTGSGWEIGDCPDEFLNESATLIKL